MVTRPRQDGQLREVEQASLWPLKRSLLRSLLLAFQGPAGSGCGRWPPSLQAIRSGFTGILWAGHLVSAKQERRCRNMLLPVGRGPDRSDSVTPWTDPRMEPHRLACTWHSMSLRARSRRPLTGSCQICASPSLSCARLCWACWAPWR